MGLADSHLDCLSVILPVFFPLHIMKKINMKFEKNESKFFT